MKAVGETGIGAVEGHLAATSGRWMACGHGLRAWHGFSALPEPRATRLALQAALTLPWDCTGATCVRASLSRVVSRWDGGGDDDNESMDMTSDSSGGRGSEGGSRSLASAVGRSVMTRSDWYCSREQFRGVVHLASLRVKSSLFVHKRIKAATRHTHAAGATGAKWIWMILSFERKHVRGQEVPE